MKTKRIHLISLPKIEQKLSMIWLSITRDSLSLSHHHWMPSFLQRNFLQFWPTFGPTYPIDVLPFGRAANSARGRLWSLQFGLITLTYNCQTKQAAFLNWPSNVLELSAWVWLWTNPAIRRTKTIWLPIWMCPKWKCFI